MDHLLTTIRTIFDEFFEIFDEFFEERTSTRLRKIASKCLSSHGLGQIKFGFCIEVNLL